MKKLGQINVSQSNLETAHYLSMVMCERTYEELVEKEVEEDVGTVVVV